MFAAKYQLKRVSQVATVVTETMQLVLSQFYNFLTVSLPKIISEQCELVKLRHINLSGPVFFWDTLYIRYRFAQHNISISWNWYLKLEIYPINHLTRTATVNGTEQRTGIETATETTEKKIEQCKARYPSSNLATFARWQHFAIFLAQLCGFTIELQVKWFCPKLCGIIAEARAVASLARGIGGRRPRISGCLPRVSAREWKKIMHRNSLEHATIK